MNRYWIVWLGWFSLAGGNFDFYIESEEAHKVYGLNNRGIFYVRNGIINQYEMTFQNQVIPASVDQLLFHWSMKKNEERIPYNINLVYFPSMVMNRPLLNISSTGLIPEMDEAFSISFPCIGKSQNPVNISIKIKFLTKSNPLLLNFRRRKMCSKSSNRLPDATSTAIALGSASVAVLLLAILLGCMSLTRKRRRSNIPCSSLARLNYVPDNRRVPYGRDCKTLSRLSSYATLASFTHVPIGAPIPSEDHRNHYRRRSSSLSCRQKQDSSELWKPSTSSIKRIQPTHQARSLVIDRGMLKLSKPPAPSLTSTSSFSSSSTSYYSSSRPYDPRHSDSVVSSVITSNPEDFPTGDTLGIKVSNENVYKTEDVEDPMPHLYPHLMPQNFKQAQQRTPGSGRSVLV